MDNPFSWDYLTTVPGSDEVFGPFAIVYLLIFGLGFVVSMVVYNGGGRGLFPNPVLFRMARRWAAIGLLVFGLGLFFFAIRLLQINPLTFGMRIWLWLSLLSVLVFAGYIVYDLRTRYAEQMRSYQEQQRKQQYLRPAAAGTATAFPAAARPARRKKG